MGLMDLSVRLGSLTLKMMGKSHDAHATSPVTNVLVASEESIKVGIADSSEPC